MKSLKEIVLENVPKLVKPDLKCIIIAVVVLIVLLYTAYRAVYLNFPVFTFLNVVFSAIFDFLDFIISGPARFVQQFF